MDRQTDKHLLFKQSEITLIKDLRDHSSYRSERSERLERSEIRYFRDQMAGNTVGAD